MRLCLLMAHNVSYNGNTRGFCYGFVLGSLYCMADEGLEACLGPRSEESSLVPIAIAENSRVWRCYIVLLSRSCRLSVR